MQVSTKELPQIGGAFNDYTRLWMNKPESYRIVGFFCLDWFIPEPPEPWLEFLISKEKRDGYWRARRCLPEEAQLMEGYGVSGVIACINDPKIEFVGMVSWSDEVLEREQKEYRDSIEKLTEKEVEDDILHLNWNLTYEYVQKLAERLGLEKPSKKKKTT